MNPVLGQLVASVAPVVLCLGMVSCASMSADPATREYVVYEGGRGPGHGMHIVFISGDEEYRSEEALPQLARMLSQEHGFTCTVLFAVNKQTGEIDPETRDNIPGLETLRHADLMVIFTRFRDLPEEQMWHIVQYVRSGRPFVGIRTATHAFQFDKHKGNKYQHYDWRSGVWPGGFGRQVLGETWIDHQGTPGKESTRGVVVPGMEESAVLVGIEPGSVWDPTSVYKVRLPMLPDISPVLYGQVLAGMTPDAKPVPDPGEGKTGKNRPMMPVAWLWQYQAGVGRIARVFTTTVGSAPALKQAGTRRLLINGCYWALGMEVPRWPKMDLVGDYEPSPLGFGKFKRGVKPADLRRQR